ncbi:AGC family protein kinase [Histomonas meleagridis]|uniref:AGC family protein kinase n=1 Tax=Histomonas meleagridis TaxID=135588 RepID=UPI00355AAC48|nr:AGC family protein kinase [Histomonas meleagridis]KAH0807148.1 AGC family protein kinase [Histomonas meleagridis]
MKIVVPNPNEPIFSLLDGNLKELYKFKAKDVTTMEEWVITFRSGLYMRSSITIDSFNIIAVIGRGFFGKVMLVESKETKELFAIKTIHKKRLVEKNLYCTVISERNVLTQANHPFIVKLHYAFQTSSKFYMVIDYCPGGELFHRLYNVGSLPIEECKFYIAQIALALDHLHSIGFVYNDLKPENVLIDADGYLKLTDFGLASQLSSKLSTCGTKEYLAPEVILRRPRTFAVDWWALGILFCEMYIGESPFYNDDSDVMFRKIVSEPIRFPKGLDRSAVSLIMGLLNKNPSQRYDFNKIKEHQFFSEFNWDDLMQRKIKPVYVPELANPFSLSNFDSEFTLEDPVDSFATPTSTENVINFSFDSARFPQPIPPAYD